MALPKAYLLVRSLSKDELTSLNEALSSHERFINILDYSASNSDKEYSKEDLFKVVYGHSYSKDKDYLLRNDLRKFATAAVEYLKSNVIQSDDPFDYLSYLYERNAFILFVREAEAHIGMRKKLLNTSDPRINELHIRYMLVHSPRLKKDFEINSAYFRRTLLAMGDAPCSIRLTILLHFAKYERIYWQHFQASFSDLHELIDADCMQADAEHQYLFEKARSFQLFGNDRIDHLKSCFDSQLKGDFQSDGEKAYLLSQLGLEYFLFADYEQAYAFYSKARTLTRSLDRSGTLQYIYNFASLLSRMKRFDEVLPLVADSLQLFQGTPVDDNIRIFLFFAYIDADDHKAMRSLLPDSETGFSRDSKIYWRVLECIVLFLEGDYETSMSFLENVYQTTRYNENVDQAFTELALLFRNFVKACLLIDKADKQAALEKCLKSSDEFIQSHELGYGSNMLSSAWLNDRIRLAASQN